MINNINGIQMEAEAHRLAVVELGVDPAKLASLAQSKRAQSLENLWPSFDKEPAVLNDPIWDARSAPVGSRR